MASQKRKDFDFQDGLGLQIARPFTFRLCFTSISWVLTWRLTDANGLFKKFDSYETMAVGFPGARLSPYRAFIL